MLDNGADPSIGICVEVAPRTHAGQCNNTAFLNELAVLKMKFTLDEIMPDTNVPWPLLALLL